MLFAWSARRVQPVERRRDPPGAGPVGHAATCSRRSASGQPPAACWRGRRRCRAARRARCSVTRSGGAPTAASPAVDRTDPVARRAPRGNRRRRAGVVPRTRSRQDLRRRRSRSAPIRCSATTARDGWSSGTDWWLSVFGRLKPGWTLERARHTSRRSRRSCSGRPCRPPIRASVPKNYLALKLIAVYRRRGAVAAARGLHRRRSGCSSARRGAGAGDRLRQPRQPAARARHRAAARDRRAARHGRVARPPDPPAADREPAARGLRPGGALACSPAPSAASFVALLELAAADPLTLSLGVDWRVARLHDRASRSTTTLALRPRAGAAMRPGSAPAA